MTGKGVHVEGIECEDWMAVNLGKEAYIIHTKILENGSELCT